MKFTPRKIKFLVLASYWLAILLLSVPTLVVLFYQLPYKYFVVMNTIGLGLALIHIVGAVAINISVEAIKGETTAVKRKYDAQTKILFILVIIFQLFNFMFIQKG